MSILAVCAAIVIAFGLALVGAAIWAVARAHRQDFEEDGHL